MFLAGEARGTCLSFAPIARPRNSLSLLRQSSLPIVLLTIVDIMAAAGLRFPSLSNSLNSSFLSRLPAPTITSDKVNRLTATKQLYKHHILSIDNTMTPLGQLVILFIAILFASGSTHAFHQTSFHFAFPGLSFGSWFFAGCCILWSSPQACRALTFSVTEVAGLTRWLVGVLRDDTIVNLRAQIEAFQTSSITTNASSAAYHQASQQLREDREVLQRGYDVSQAIIKTLQLTVDKLQSELSMNERNYNVDAVEADRKLSRYQLDTLKLELSAKEKEIERLQVAAEDYRKGAARSSNDMYSLASENDKLQKDLDAKTKRTFELESTLVQLHRDMYQRMLQADKFDSFKEIIHQLIEAGGEQMIVVVLFLLCLAEKQVDLAELGVDEAQFLTYKDYAMAVASGRQSPLFPQGVLL